MAEEQKSICLKTLKMKKNQLKILVVLIVLGGFIVCKPVNNSGEHKQLLSDTESTSKCMPLEEKQDHSSKLNETPHKDDLKEVIMASLRDAEVKKVRTFRGTIDKQVKAIEHSTESTQRGGVAKLAAITIPATNSCYNGVKATIQKTKDWYNQALIRLKDSVTQDRVNFYSQLEQIKDKIMASSMESLKKPTTEETLLILQKALTHKIKQRTKEMNEIKQTLNTKIAQIERKKDAVKSRADKEQIELSKIKTYAGGTIWEPDQTKTYLNRLKAIQCLSKPTGLQKQIILKGKIIKNDCIYNRCPGENSSDNARIKARNELCYIYQHQGTLLSQLQRNELKEWFRRNDELGCL